MTQVSQRLGNVSIFLVRLKKDRSAKDGEVQVRASAAEKDINGRQDRQTEQEKERICLRPL